MFGDWVGWTYEECVPDMKFRSWMSAHVRMFQAAGGTPTSSFPTAVSPRQFLLGIVVSSVCRAGLYGPPRGPSPPIFSKHASLSCVWMRFAEIGY